MAASRISMEDPHPHESEILKSVLEPLLEDFCYWFDLSINLLEREKLEFLPNQEQDSLLQRVKDTLQAVNTAKMLFKVTGEQVGVDLSAMMPWHQLLMECQAVGMRYHQSRAN